MKTAVSLPDDLSERADREAQRRGITRSALYAEALRSYLDDRSEFFREMKDAVDDGRYQSGEFEPFHRRAAETMDDW